MQMEISYLKRKELLNYVKYNAVINDTSNALG